MRVHQSIQAASLKSQGMTLFGAKLLAFALSVALPLLVVRLLSKEDVGIYRQMFQVVVNAVAILPLGLSMSAFYYLNREEHYRKSAVLNILLFNLLLGGACFTLLAIYPNALGYLFQSPEMAALAPKVGIIIWLWIFSSFLEVVTIANRQTSRASVYIVLSQLLKTGLMVAAVAMYSTIDAFIYAAIIQGIIQTVVLLLYLNAHFPKFWRHFDISFFRQQLLYALPFGLMGILWTLQNDIHNYFVGYRFSEAEFAIYAFGCFNLPLVGILSESTTAVLLPRMNELQSRGDKNEMLAVTARATQRLSYFLFPLYVFLTITAYVFITTLFTKQFVESVPIFLVYLTLLPFHIWVVDPIARAHKEWGKPLMLLKAVMLTVLVVALFYGIRDLDLVGITTIVVAAGIVDRILSTVFIGYKMGVTPNDWKLFSGIVRVGLAAVLSGMIVKAAYIFLAPVIMEQCVSLLSASYKIRSNTAALDFISGSLFLGIWLLFYGGLYGFFVIKLGALEASDAQAVKGMFSRVHKRIDST